jgi:hypothetical protein
MNEQKMIADAAKDWNEGGGEIGTPFGLVKLTVSVDYIQTYGCGTVWLSAVANGEDVLATLPESERGGVELSAGWIADELAQGASIPEIVAQAVLVRGPQDFATLVRSNRDRGQDPMNGIFSVNA